MRATNAKETFLILLAVACQMFVCLNIFFINQYIEVMEQPDSLFIKTQLDLTSWILVTVLARVVGAYLIGKYAEKVGIWKSILFISKYFVLISIFLSIFCITQEINYEISYGFYLFRFFYCLLEPAAFIFPCFYILERSSSSDRYKISAAFLVAVFIAKAFSYYFVQLSVECVKLWYVFLLVAALVAWVLYYYLEQQTSLEKEISSKVTFVPWEIKILTGLLGAACAATIFYHYFFESYYSLNIKIIDANAELGSITYYSLCALFFFPSLKLCEKFNLYKIIQLSLTMLFILGVNSIFANSNAAVYIAQQILFAFFSSLFIAPILAILHKIYKDYPNILVLLFSFVLGFSACTILARLEQQMALQKGLGWFVYAASIFLCFMVTYRLRAYIEKDISKKA